MTTILNADPDPVRRSDTTRLLREAGFSVREAVTAGEALAAVLEGPDLVLLDVSFDLDELLQANPQTASIPVLLWPSGDGPTNLLARVWAVLWQEQFREVGELAHQLNNVFTSLSGNAELLLRQLREDDPTRELTQKIRKIAERGAALVRRLAAISLAGRS